MRRIPKIIHQIWIGPEKKPDMWMKTFEQDYINQNKDWKYMFWNEAAIDKLKMINRDLYENEKSYQCKSDIVRYEILYQYGGVYIDADCVWVNNKSLNSLLDKTYEEQTGIFAGYEPDTKQYKKMIANSTIGIQPNDSRMLELIHQLRPRYLNLRNKKKFLIFFEYKVHEITGPVFFSEFFKNKNITVFPAHYFYPIFWYGITDLELHKKIKIPEDSYMFQYGYTTSSLKNKVNNYDTSKKSIEGLNNSNIQSYNIAFFLIIILLLVLLHLIVFG